MRLASHFALCRFSDNQTKAGHQVLQPDASLGVLAATFFSLLLPAIDYGELQFHSRNAAVAFVITGILCGAGALFLMHRFLPHEHFLAGHEGPHAKAEAEG